MWRVVVTGGLVVDARRRSCDYCVMPNDATPTTPANAYALIDAQTLANMARRDAIANANQRMRDARRSDYDNALMSTPITLALRALRVPPSRMNATQPPRPPRVHRDTRLATGPNAWESNAPHARANMAPDRECHHPLVKCHHKW